MGQLGIQETTEDFGKAIAIIDNKFGDGYAKNNPVLLAAFLQSVSSYETCIGAGQIEDMCGTVEHLVGALSEHASALTGVSE